MLTQGASLFSLVNVSKQTKRGYHTMRSTTVKVTPTMAAEWLARCNTKNRRVNKIHVQKLANEMKSGRWTVNGETIAFDEDMVLIDGQHRLNAIVQSGVTIETIVVYGVEDPRAFATTGALMLKRSAGQIADMMGLTKNTNLVVAAAKILHAWSLIDDYDEFASKALTRSTDMFAADEIAEISVSYSEDLNDLLKSYGKGIRLTGSPGAALALAYIMQSIDPIATHTMFSKLTDGIFVDKKDPVKHLYEAVIRQKYPIKNKKLYTSALIVKTFNYVSNGSEINILRWRTDGNMPEKFPRIKGMNK